MEKCVIKTDAVVDNRTICDLFGVANMGGIRVNKSRNLIVLISNNTDPTYRNEWKDDQLHFVGMGATGPQKLDRQNKTLANANKSGAALHLFEVFEKSRYVYVGQVELADEPYMSEQNDARADNRFVWVFPLRRKANTAAPEAGEVQEDRSRDHLPHGAYAVIGANLDESQVALVNEAMDRLREAGVTVLDQRDIDLKRYQKALGVWHEAVLDHVRSAVRELIAKRKRAAKNENRTFGLIDDELKVNSASTENELRDALKFLDRDDPIAMEQVFEEARSRVPMPEAPKSLQNLTETEPMDVADLERAGVKRVDPARFRDFT
jgi:hypothetical protein